MTRTLTFTVEGEPVPKGRAKASHMGGIVRLYTPAKTRDWEAHVHECAVEAAKAQGWDYPPRAWYELTVRVYRRYELKGGDASNYGKALEDGCNGAIWHDDSQVRDVRVVVAQDEANPRLEVEVVMVPYETPAQRRARLKRAAFRTGDRVYVGHGAYGIVIETPEDDPDEGGDGIVVADEGDDSGAGCVWERGDLARMQAKAKRARSKEAA